MAETGNEAVVVQQTAHVNEETSNEDYGWLEKSNKSLHSSLVELDSSLECPICYDHFRIPVTLSQCQHSFCSECIRATFKAQMKLVMKNQKQECPVCRTPASSEENCTGNRIVPNLLLGRIVRSFWEVKSHLSQLPHTSADVTSSISQKGAVTNCNLTYANKSPTTVTTAAAPARKLLPRRRGPTRYYGLKRKQLQALCQSAGLSVLGTDEELRQRHADFCLLVNAECDSEFPRTEDEIRLELETREKHKKLALTSDQRMHSSITSSIENLKQARKRAGEEPTAHLPVKSGDPAFDRMITNGFQKLISEVSSKRHKCIHGGMINTNQSNNNDQVACTNSKPLGCTDSDVFGERPTEETMKIDRSDTNSSASFHLLPSSIIVADDCKTVDSSLEGFFPSSNNSNDSMFHELEMHRRHELEMHRRQHMAKGVPEISNRTPSLSTEKKISSAPNHQLVSSMNTMLRKTNPLFSPTNERSIIGPWYCPVCTYYNTNRNWLKASCEMCEQGQRSMAPK